MTIRVRAYVSFVITLAIIGQCIPQNAYAVSTWNPTLLVNTESFQQIDDGDGTSTVDLQFGATTSTLKLLTTNTFQFNKSLSVLGGISGSYLTIDHQANISGSLVVKENAVIRGNLSGTSFFGSGLGDCSNTTTSKLVYNSTTGKFLCATDQTGGSSGGGGWSNTGSLQTAFDNRFVNQHGDTMTGALTIRTSTTQTATGALNVLQQTHATGAYIKSATTKETALAIDIVGTANAPHLLFGYQGIFDTNLYRSAVSRLQTNSSFFAAGTISGSKLRVDGNADVHGALSASGALRTDSNITVNDDADTNDAVLTFGNNSGNQTLKFLNSSQKFQFTRGLSVIGVLSGSQLAIDGGATISGALLVKNSITTKSRFSGSTLRISGAADVHGALSASGAVHFDSDLSINDDRTSAVDAVLTFGNSTLNQDLKYIHANQRFQFSTNINVLGSISGSSLIVSGASSFSGAALFRTSVTTKSSFSGSSFFGSGLGDCNNTTTSKIIYSPSTGKFTCATDQTGGSSGGGLGFTDASGIFVNQGGDSMTGALTIDYATNDVFTLSGGVMTQGAYGVPALLSGANIGTNVRDIYVSGKYAFVGQESVSGPDIRIFDIHNRAAPTYIAGIDVGANVNKLLHAGKYLYVGTSTIAGTCTRDVVTGCEFRIYDVSNLSTPVAIGGVNIGIGVNDIQIVGELVYLANDTVTGTCNSSTGATINGCELQVYDVSNPYAPQPIGGVNDTVDARALYVSGGQVYVAYDSDSGAGNELKIFSIMNHSSLISLGGINAGVAALNFNTILVSGRYTYIGTSVDANTCSGSTVTGCEFRVYDTGNPASPTAVSGLSFDVGVNSLDIAGGTVFAGLASSSTTDLKTIDVHTLTAPVVVGGREMGIGINSVAVAGKYIYVGSDVQTGIELHLLDAPGIETPTATIGSIQASNLTVTESARVNNGLFVGNGLNVGRGGVNLRGALSVQSTSTGSLYTGLDIKNSTGTMMFSVRDDGFADVGRGVTGYNGYLGEEFNDEKAAITADGVAWGDSLNWVSDVSTTTCSFSVPEAWPSATRLQITAASVGCNLYMGLANADPMNFVNSTGSLARVLIKVRLNSANATAHSWIGLSSAWPANNVAEPVEGIYFTGSGGTVWQGTVNTTTGISQYVTCPGATIQTGFNKFALLDITTESPTRVRFRVDPDTSDGINFINCGTANPLGVKSMLGVGSSLVTTAAFAGTAQQDIDFIRVWTK